MDTRSRIVGIVMAAACGICGFAEAQVAPKMVSVTPEIGAKDVDPGLMEIRVVFDQEMAGGFSWTGGGDAYPEVTAKPHWEADKKTCVLPVKLKPAAFHRVGANSSGHQNFRSASGVPAQLYVIYFATKGADEATLAKLEPPKVVTFLPANGDEHVLASIDKLVVTFDRPMGGGFSWTKAGAVYPEGTGKPEWSADMTTCTLPVKLIPNQTYNQGLNSPVANNFQSATGVPLTPVVWTFTTVEK